MSRTVEVDETWVLRLRERQLQSEIAQLECQLDITRDELEDVRDALDEFTGPVEVSR